LTGNFLTQAELEKQKKENEELQKKLHDTPTQAFLNDRT
jgi:hypothetical protein